MLWFTGLSGSGKSTIAVRVHEELARRGVEVEYIDGDALREVFPATGFTRAEREEHLRRTGYMASRLAALDTGAAGTQVLLSLFGIRHALVHFQRTS